MTAKTPDVANPQPAPAAVDPAPALTNPTAEAAAKTSGADKSLRSAGTYTSPTGLTVVTR